MAAPRSGRLWPPRQPVRSGASQAGMQAGAGLLISCQLVVRAVGVEPTLLTEPDFESGASANSATPA